MQFFYKRLLLVKRQITPLPYLISGSKAALTKSSFMRYSAHTCAWRFQFFHNAYVTLKKIKLQPHYLHPALTGGQIQSQKIF